jgi:protein SCO1/2
VNPRLITALAVAGVISAAAIVIGALGQRSASAEPVALSPGVTAPASPFEGATTPPGVRAPDFSLRDQDGEPVSMRALRGRPVVVTFLRSKCDESCGPQAQQIKGALNDLGRDVPVLAVSVDPREDTPSAARHFLEEQGMVGRMDLVLGSRKELEPLWKGFAIQPQERRLEHQARIALIDARGFQRVGFPLDQATPERIAHDLAVLGA